MKSRKMNQETIRVIGYQDVDEDEEPSLVTIE